MTLAPRSRISRISAFVAGSLILVGAANAQVVFTGNAGKSGVSPNVIVTVGGTGVGSLSITNGASLSSKIGTVGLRAGGNGTATVSGAGSTWTIAQTLVVGGSTGSPATGALIIQNGGAVSSAGGVSIGNYGGGNTGSVTVTGTGSSLTTQNGITIGSTSSSGTNTGPGSSSGTLTISAGGVVSNTDNSVDLANGSATVTGAGSRLQDLGTQNVNGVTIPDSFFVGDGSAGPNGGNATLTISNGGAVETDLTGIGFSSSPGKSGTGAITVDGAGSILSTEQSQNFGMPVDLSLAVGMVGTGSLTLSNGGAASVLNGTGTALLGVSSLSIAGQTLTGTSAGTLNIGGTATGPAAAGGILNAAGVSTGGGTGTVQFNTTATSANPYFFTRNGTSGGGAVAIGGTASVVNTAGVNVLTGVNTYIGSTAVNGGTLEFAAGSSLANSSTLTNTGGLELGSGAQITVGSISNSGSIVIGSGAALDAGTFTQSSGSTLLNNGTLDPVSIEVDGGIFGGTGLLDGNLSLSDATLQVGAEGGLGELSLNGDLTQNGGSVVFDIESNGTGGFDVSSLIMNPGAGLSIDNAAIEFDFLGGANPLEFYGEGGFNIDTFIQLNGGGLLSSSSNLSADFQNDSFSISTPGYAITGFNRESGAFTVSSVPDAAPTALMLALSLAALPAAASRRRARRA